MRLEEDSTKRSLSAGAGITEVKIGGLLRRDSSMHMSDFLSSLEVNICDCKQCTYAAVSKKANIVAPKSVRLA